MLTHTGQPPQATTVSSRALVGVINPPTQVILARPIAQHADPGQGVAALRQIWHSFAYDTSAMLAALIATDWRYLQPGITAADDSATAGEHVVAGVGVATSGDRQPVNFCLTEAGDLAVDWIYLIDPVTDTVAVYTGDGWPDALHRLAG